MVGLRALGCVLVVGCSTGGASGGAPDASTDAPQGAPVVFTMGAHVAAGADTYGCRYVAMPESALFVVGASHEYSLGNHHLLVFRTDLTAIPPGAGAERDCFAPDDVMLHARAEVYGAQARSGTFALPAGVALPMRAGEVLLMQAHYLNAGAADVDASITLTVQITADAPAQRAGTFFFADPFIDVPAAQKAKAQIRCAVPQAATIVAASAYAHARAVDFAAFVDTDAPGASPFYRAPGFANPLPLQTTLAVGAGAHVRMVCSYDNSRGASELFGGPRNDADEACILSGVYYPDLGDDVAACRAGPDMFGTGAAACAATRTCVEACPASAAPPADLGLGRALALDPCWQKCVVASCPSASALLLALRACAAARCASECAAPGAACTTCTQASCAKEAGACAADACN